jgi:hypothetical protein
MAANTRIRIVHAYAFFTLYAAAAIPQEQAHRVVYCMSGEYDVSKQRDCVPHDIGDPGKAKSTCIHLAFAYSVYRSFS